MAPDRPVAPIRTFLVERYGADTSQAGARRESAAAQRAAQELSGEGRPVRLIGSLLVPSDETVFSLFGASASEDVAAVGERADQPYDRISEGVPVTRVSGVAGRVTSAGDVEEAPRSSALPLADDRGVISNPP